MSKKKNKDKIKNIILIIIIFCIFGYTFYYFSSNAADQILSDNELSFISNKYSASLENVNTTKKTLKNNIFANPVFKSLRSFVSLPLELGRVGKENPFAAPPSPLDDLLKEANQ